jgi:hypothetical protein
MDCMEYDLILRLAKKYIFVNLGEIVNYDFYHLDHELPRKPLRYGRNRKTNPPRSVEYPPEEFNPSGKDWGLIQYPFQLTTYPSDQITRYKGSGSGFFSRWVSFLWMVLISGLQMFMDFVILNIETAVRSIPGCMAKVGKRLVHQFWIHRLHVARETIAGKPVRQWLKLLRNRWMNR